MTPSPRWFPAAFLLAAGCASHRSPPSLPTPADVPDTLVVRIAPARCPPPAPCPPPPDPRLRDVPRRADAALWVALDSLADADFVSHGGLLGAFVQRLGDTTPLWSRSPDARLLPASTQKVFTISAALAELGPRFRWRTQLWMTGSVQDSVLRGNLLLEGGGDPTLGMSEGTGMAGLAAAVRRAGIRVVHGNLVAVDTLVGRGLEAWPPGWTVGSSRDGYGAPVTGLSWNQNRIGDRSIPEPRPTALKGLQKALLAKGIRVLGTDTTVKVRGDSIGSRRTWTRVGGVASAELEPIARACLRESINPFAEAMLLALGLGRRGNPREGGRRHLQEWLIDRGVDPARLVVDDGSGLSRYDLATARIMARLLERDARGPEPRLVSLLPHGGEGTLRRRVPNFPDPSVVVAKTGTLDGVANLAGYLVRPGRDTLAFAFLCNGFAGSPRPVRLFQDRLLTVLAGLPLRTDSASDSADTSAARTDTANAASPAGDAPAVPAAPRIPPPAPGGVAADSVHSVPSNAPGRLPQAPASPPASPIPADSAISTPTGTVRPPETPVDSLPPGWEDFGVP